jgi:hypothetical protein
VYRAIRAAFQDGLFDLLDEQPLTADLVQRAILDAIARGDDVQLASTTASNPAELGHPSSRLG